MRRIRRCGDTSRSSCRTSCTNRRCSARDALAELIERYPREHYSLIQTGPKGGKRVWREGEIGSFDGEQVMRAIAGGGLWLMMRDVGTIDASYYAHGRADVA